MIINFAAKVDIGIKETNDDRVLIGGNILDNTSYSGEVDIPAVVVVCDGCGGYLGGNIAAQIVLEHLSSENQVALAEAAYLKNTLEACKKIVFEKKLEMPQFSEMCTTIAGCVFCNDSIIIFHSGDSRVYRQDKWGIAKMTKDHSIVQDMVDMGEITPEEALTHPKRNVIKRCIGVDGLPPDIYVSHTPIAQGDRYLLCSDGLWEYVQESEIEEVLNSNLTLQQMTDELVEKALCNGSDDNISVCICTQENNM